MLLFTKKQENEDSELTAHAGETAGADSIWTVVEKLGVERIGHGVRAYEDPRLVSLLKEREIPLEMCVTSNVRTGVCKSVEFHPIKQYFQEGLVVTVNSDDPTMFNTSITREYLVLARKLKFTIGDLKRLIINGIGASFMPDKKKELIKSQFEEEWHQLLNKYY
ncbi:MAG: adenosine deaminase [Candidatus Methanolliviera sp. GoM_oil]|nr:MAG: adenosine deaminase [Candidatus Methanolliviera sp. GoM_oil]